MMETGKHVILSRARGNIEFYYCQQEKITGVFLKNKLSCSATVFKTFTISEFLKFANKKNHLTFSENGL